MHQLATLDPPASRLTFDVSTAEAYERDGRPTPILGCSESMARVRELISRIAPAGAPVLITGESGTGKELVAHELHRQSGRTGQFIAINCASIPETMFESELFGHQRGSFTGAEHDRIGRFAVADGGTFLFDEVVELPECAQAKLLRVIEDQVVTPIGANTSVELDVRVLAATNRDLAKEVVAGRFREDLYHRLKVLDVRLSPLRDRPDDLPLLVERFLRASGSGTLTSDAWAALLAHPYPGNVRELKNAIERAVILAGGGPITRAHLPPEMTGAERERPPPATSELRPLVEARRAFEAEYIRLAIERVGGRKTEAARLLGISRKSLWERLKREREVRTC